MSSFASTVPRPLPIQQATQRSEWSLTSRRLHAKLLAWTTKKETGCLVGSANFTSAALDGKNVEACLYVPDADQIIGQLFDKQFSIRKIQLSKFKSGKDREPENDQGVPTPLRIHAALLMSTNRLRVSYSCSENVEEDTLVVGLRAVGESRPRVTSAVPYQLRGKRTLVFDENVWHGGHGSFLITLSGSVAGERVESPPVWIIQEDRLTHEPSEGGSSSGRSEVEETGFPLPEFLEALRQAQGLPAVIEYLDHLNIRFVAGSTRGLPGRKFRLRRRDPFHPDVPPEWLKEIGVQKKDLHRAILGFVERHEKTRLKKHARLGNINGMENFLDVFIAVTRLLYAQFKRGVVKKPDLSHHIARCNGIATVGFDYKYGDSSPGYLKTLAANLHGEESLIREVCKELNFAGHLEAATLISEMLHVIPKEDWQDPAPARGSIQGLHHRIEEGLALAGVPLATDEEIVEAIRMYDMFSKKRLAYLEKEIRAYQRC